MKVPSAVRLGADRIEVCPAFAGATGELCLIRAVRGYIGFRNSVSAASSFRCVSAKRRPGGTLCFPLPVQRAHYL